MQLEFLLRPPMETKKMLAVYCNRCATDKFFVGNLIHCNSDGLSLFLLSQKAKLDGIGYFHSESIFRIEQETQYLQQIERKAQNDITVVLHGSPWDGFLTYAEEHGFVIQIRGSDVKRSLFGIPIMHTNNHIVIQRVYMNGNLGKVFNVSRNQIVCMVCNSSTEKKISKNIKARGDKYAQ